MKILEFLDSVTKKEPPASSKKIHVETKQIEPRQFEFKGGISKRAASRLECIPE